MQTAKTDQTGQMPRLIWVFAGCTCHFVDFVMRQLKCQIARDEWTFSFVGHALTWLHDIKDMSVYGSVNCPALSNSLEVKFVTGTVFVFRFSRHFFRGLWCAPIMKASLWPWASPWKTYHPPMPAIIQMSHLMTKPTKWHVCKAKTQISLGFCPVWSESLLWAQWVAKVSSCRQWRLGRCSCWAESSLCKV